MPVGVLGARDVTIDDGAVNRVAGPPAFGDPKSPGANAFPGIAPRVDHIHGLPAGGGAATFAAPALVLGTANADGVSPNGIRTDASVAVFDATAPVTQAFGDAAAVGAAAVSARRDHKHGMPAAPAAGGSPTPGPISGKLGWFTPPYVTPTGAGAVIGAGVNTMYAYPVWLISGHVVDRVGVMIGGAVATAQIRIGLYADGGAGPTGAALFDSGAIAAAAAGFSVATVSYTVPATGWYWLAWVFQTAEPNVETASRMATTMRAGQPSAIGQSPTALVNTGVVSGALPTWVLTLTNPASAVPLLWFRIT